MIRPFTLEEIKNAVFQMNGNEAHCPDGFNMLFYQTFWDMLKEDLWNLCRDLEKDHLDLKMLNYANI